MRRAALFARSAATLGGLLTSARNPGRAGAAHSAAQGVPKPVAAPSTLATTGAPPVPAAYWAHAAFLDAKLDAFNPGVVSGRSTTRFGVELYLANSSRGDALLKPDAYVSLELQLARLQELGAGGVTISIHEDVLGRSPRAAEYVAFYRRLAEDVRSRGLTLVVESSASLVAVYGTLSFGEYRLSRRTAVERILSDLRPDYLTIATEPSTEAGVTRYAELATPVAYRDFVAFLLSSLSRGRSLVGAGAGTWEDRAYVEDHFVRMDLDFIGLHVYPVGQDFLQRIVESAATARRHRMRSLIGEAWLYKVTDAELLLRLPASVLYARDVFSFWQPLDQKFLEKLVRVARAERFAYASAFWSQYFFASLDYNGLTAGLTPAQLNALVGTEAVSAMLLGTLTPTGQYYRALIAA